MIFFIAYYYEWLQRSEVLGSKSLCGNPWGITPLMIYFLYGMR